MRNRIPDIQNLDTFDILYSISMVGPFDFVLILSTGSMPLDYCFKNRNHSISGLATKWTKDCLDFILFLFI
jgi:hypothetical protein